MEKAIIAAILAALGVIRGEQLDLLKKAEDNLKKTDELIAYVKAQPCSDCFANVSTAAELNAALADPTTDTIRLTADITANVTITRPVKLMGVDLPLGRVQGVQLPDQTWQPFIPMPKLRGKVFVQADNVTFGPGIEFVPGVYDTLIESYSFHTGLTLDRVVIDGEDTGTVKNGVTANAANVTVKDSVLVGIWKVGQESHAIAAWTSPGPFNIDNNALEAGSCNIIFGGAVPADGVTIAQNIRFTRNYSYKRAEWRAFTNRVVKNLFEAKAATDVYVADNVFDGSWVNGQAGYAVLFTTKASGTSFPTARIERVTFERNTVLNSYAGMQITTADSNFVNAGLDTLTVRDNLWVLSGKWFVLILGGPKNVTIDHNTVIHTQNSLAEISKGSIRLADGSVVAGGPIPGFRFTNNLVVNGLPQLPDQNIYGMRADSITNGRWIGTSTLVPNAVVEGNVFASVPTLHGYPASNRIVTIAEFNAALDPTDYRIVNEAFAGVSTDGTPVGRR